MQGRKSLQLILKNKSSHPRGKGLPAFFAPIVTEKTYRVSQIGVKENPMVVCHNQLIKKYQDSQKC